MNVRPTKTNKLKFSAAMAAMLCQNMTQLANDGSSKLPSAAPPERKDWPKYEAEPPLPLKERRKLLAKKLRDK